MSAKCDTCLLDSEISMANFRILELPSCSDLSPIDNISSNFSPKKSGFVYKRKKLQTNGIALVSENATETSKESACCQSSISSEDHTLIVQKGEPGITIANFSVVRDTVIRKLSSCEGQLLQVQRTLFISEADVNQNLLSAPNSMPIINSPGEDKVPQKSSFRDRQSSKMKHNCRLEGKCSSSNSDSRQRSDSKKNKVDSGECSSSDNIVAESLGEFTSVKEMCIYVLKSHGLLGVLSKTSASTSLEVWSGGDAKTSQSCMICGHLENLSDMLVCDLCDQAFHVSCCSPPITKLPIDEWYCKGCSNKIPKPSSQPYRTRIRIGRDFQAEVPEWSGPTYGAYSDSDPSSEPYEIDPAEYANLSESIYKKPATSTSIGNWVQCCEVINTSDGNEGTVCGKWRRAPLSVVQTDNWDCSSAVLWDPIHADCSVPQELETDVVLKHLKYVEKLRQRLANKKQKYG